MISDPKPYPAYKDSGVEWLGEVPEHWEAVPIARIGQLFKGNGGNKDDELASGIPCVRYGDLYTRHEFFVRSTKACVSRERASSYTPIRHGDLLFAASGETIEDIGRSAVNLMDGEACCGGDVLLLRPDREVNATFLGYAADAAPSRHQKASMGRGFTVVHIYASQLKRLVLPLPPFPEQSAIVRFLDHADRRIRRYIHAKQKLIKLLEEQKQAIIHQAVTRGLDPNVRLKPSGVEWLGDVPEHWEIMRLKSLVMQAVAGPYGSSLTKAMYTQMGYRVYGQQQVIPDDFTIGDYYISEEQFAQMQRYKVFPGDVLVSVMGTVGRVAVVPEDAKPGIINPRLVRYQPDITRVRARYLQLAMQGVASQAQLREAAKGTTMEGLNMQILGKLELAIPPLREQDAILDKWRVESAALISTEYSVYRQISLLREYRTRLIADVVTGKLDVREAAVQLPADTEEPESIDELDALTEAEEEETAELAEAVGE